MPDSPVHSPPNSPIPSPQPQTNPQIPVEFITEEEMALLESALSAARSSIPSMRISMSLPQFQVSVRSIESITFHSKRSLASCSQGGENVKDIEELGNNAQKRNRRFESLLRRFRRSRALSVSDIVQSEWCQKQMEFTLVRGRPKPTEAMKAGTDRHAQLEKEVIQKVEVRVKEIEDFWALRLINFIIGTNQLLFEGLTRELPIVSFVQDVWMVGVIDEVRLPINELVQSPFLVENKTRSQATLPSEAQKRNGKLQLMCYKYMWDNVVTDDFPASRFYTFFSLNCHYILSEEVQDLAATSGFPAKTLDDTVMYYRNACATLSPARDELLLRYEFQGDHSFLGEENFSYDSDWLLSHFKRSLDFWLGVQEPSYVSQEESWKCRHCKFASVCPNSSVESTPTQADEKQTPICPSTSVGSTPMLADEQQTHISPSTSLESTANTGRLAT